MAICLSGDELRKLWILLVVEWVSDWKGLGFGSKKAFAAWMQLVMTVMWFMCAFSSALSRPKQMAMTSASIDVTLVAWSVFLLVREFDDHVWDTAVAVSFLTPPSATIQVLDIED